MMLLRNRLEGAGSAPVHATMTALIRSAESEARITPAKPEAAEEKYTLSQRAKKELPVPEAKPMLSHTLTDFGLYKCEACGKM